MTWLDIAIAAFAVYYAARAIAQEDGPFGVFDRLRARWDTGYLGKGVRCIVCVAAYTALVAAALLGWRLAIDPWLLPLLWLGLAGAATFINKVWLR